MIAPPRTVNETARLASLDRTGMAFSPAEERFDRITRMARRLLEVPCAIVSLVGEQCQWFKSIDGMENRQSSREAAFCAWAITSDDLMVVNDASIDPRFSSNALVAGPPHIRFYAGCPIVSPDGHRIGTLCVIDQQPRDLDDEQRATLRDLARLVESELRQSELSVAQRALLREVDELRRCAMLDPLTGAWNRTGFEEMFDRERSAATRSGAKLSLLVVDIDRLSLVNETFGRDLGNELIGRIAARLRGTCRPYDSVARIGGSSFAVLMPGCPSAGAIDAAERVRVAVTAQKFTLGRGTPVPATVSIGITEVGEHDSPSSALERAGVAVEHCKREGRNRVRFNA